MRRELAIVQVVPRLGALLDGVGDYAAVLAASMAKSQEVQSTFLSCDPLAAAGGSVATLPSMSLPAHAADEFRVALQRCGERSPGADKVLLLHYVNYGYEARGCPFWLLESLKAWKQHDPLARLVTIFHELYASGPPWRSSFWLSPVQRNLARELYGISDAVVTNREQSRQWLDRGQPDARPRTSVMPVFSTLGELDGQLAWAARSAEMVVAGRSGAVDRAYGKRREQLIEACRVLEIDEIVDVGARSDPVPARVGNIPVTALGHLAPAQVSARLARARAGFLDYPSDYLGKSTVFAAFAAHGLVPVVAWHRGEEEAGLQEGANYWVPEPCDRAARDFQSIATQANAWYAGHRLDLQARAFATMLRGDPA